MGGHYLKVTLDENTLGISLYNYLVTFHFYFELYKKCILGFYYFYCLLNLFHKLVQVLKPVFFFTQSEGLFRRGHRAMKPQEFR